GRLPPQNPPRRKLDSKMAGDRHGLVAIVVLSAGVVSRCFDDSNRDDVGVIAGRSEAHARPRQSIPNRSGPAIDDRLQMDDADSPILVLTNDLIQLVTGRPP